MQIHMSLPVFKSWIAQFVSLILILALDNDLSGGYCCPLFEQAVPAGALISIEKYNLLCDIKHVL